MNGIEIKFNDGSILICDGELGLAEAFADYAAEQKYQSSQKNILAEQIPIPAIARFVPEFGNILQRQSEF